MIKEIKDKRTIVSEYIAEAFHICDKCGAEKQFHRETDGISMDSINSDWTFITLSVPEGAYEKVFYVPGKRKEIKRHYCPNCWPMIQELL